jgi:hypothetical protein
MKNAFWPLTWAIAQLAALWFGFIEGMTGALNVAYFMAWLTAAISLFALSDRFADEVGKKPPALPAWFAAIYHVVTTFAFVWNGAMVTAIAFAVGVCIVWSARKNARDRAQSQAI